MKRYLNLNRAGAALLVAASLTLAACGGGSGGGGGGGGGGPAPTTSITGKAADGYLFNATVCLDTNGNKRCDSDELNTTTGEGGVFTLDGVTADDVAKYAVVVEVVENVTIDEDTGPIAEGFVLSAPPGKPEFVSPLTTAVHGVLEQNPALGTELAAAKVKRLIGAGEDVGLFDDYVEQKNTDKSREYERLYRIAQVSARILAKNKKAVDKAVDEAVISADAGTLSTLVVDQLLNQLKDTAAKVDEAGDSFSVDQVTFDIIGSEDIETELAKVEFTPITTKEALKEALSDGIIWLESEDDEDGEHEYEYGVIKLNKEKNVLDEEVYQYNGIGWSERHDDNDHFRLVLDKNGEWQKLDESPSNWKVEFNTDGSAKMMLPGEADEVLITASVRSIAGEKIKAFLGSFWYTEGFADQIPDWAEFSEEAKAYRVGFTQTVDAYQLDYWGGGPDGCEKYGGNCNVVWGYANSKPVNKFDELIFTDKASTEHGNCNYTDIGHKLTACLIADGILQIKDSQVDGDPVITDDGSWEEREVRGQRLIVLNIPKRFNRRMWDDTDHIFFVEDNGWVRRGTVYPKGEDMYGDDVYLNQQAMDDIIGYFKTGQ